MGILSRLDTALFTVDMGARLALERLETGIAFNPTREEQYVDPHPFYKRLRERDPIHRSRIVTGWVLSRYDDVLRILTDKSFSSDERNWRRYARFARRRRLAGLSDPYDEGRMTLLRMDPPDHTRLRNLVNKAFTPRAVERMRPRIEQLVDELLTPLEGRSEAELVRDFAAPLPVVVIAEMLGVPIDDRERFRHWSNEVVRLLGEGTPADEIAGEKAAFELRDYFAKIVEQRRAEPRDDLISALALAEERGDRLSEDELYGILVLLLVAGNETTTKLIGNGAIALLRNRDQLELLRSEPKRISGAIDELLRYDGPVQFTSRMVTQDGELHGRPLRRGEQLILVLAGANRDPAAFPEPERLDVTRENVRHLGLGQGIHFCLGAQLARLEAACAFEGLLPRFPGLSLSPRPIEWGRNTILRGPRALPLALR